MVQRGHPFDEIQNLLMVQKSGDHQLILVKYPIIYRVLFPGGDRRISEPSTVVSGLSHDSDSG